MNISDYIKDLLVFNEKVVLPGFGAFQIIRKPATFDDLKISPPSSVIVFNPEETLDDNLLTSRYADAEEIDIDTARQRILEFIDEIKFAHSKGDKYLIPGLGELFLDDNNNYVFEKDPLLILDFETAGFESFELDPSDEEFPSEDEDSANTDELEGKADESIGEEADSGTGEAGIPETSFEDEITAVKSNRNFLWILSGSIVVILLTFIILTLSTDLFDNIDKVFFKAKDIQSTEKPVIIFGGDEDYESGLDAAIDSLTKLENALRMTGDISAQSDAGISVYSEFHIIAGSFSVYKYAEDLQKELNFRGFPSLIVNRGDGFYRVSAIHYKDKELALKELETFRKNTPYKSAWLLGLN